jgi:hypothetical protein
MKNIKLFQRMGNLMSYIDEIFERVNLQQMRAFLFHGAELTETTPLSDEQRLHGAADEATQLLKHCFPDSPEAYERAECTILDALGVYGEVYMEVGLQAGFFLVKQMISR